MRGEQETRHRTVFLGGLHRSGTTLLASLIATHPQVSGFRQTGAPEDEGQHLQTVCPIDEHHGGPGRFAYVPEAHMTERSPLATAANGRLLRQQWSRYWDLSRPVLVEKSPPNLLRFRFLQHLFAGSRFIFVMRHPIPVALSTRKWTPALTVRQVVRHWVHAYDIAAADAAMIDSLLLVRYEDLMVDPSTTMKSIAEFLDLSADFELGALDRVTNARYHARWLSSPERAADDLHDLEPDVLRHGYHINAC
ncbi:sulfotransferase family protein [Phytohabitans rumicis]|uniref:Sulfotransferase family protein n=1 Tax=Phytohabitans rumicis TaxID=1076125 RepID=A0A6V8KNN4_9ACTN|nr:sulfotransferase [Phytohabitans rumicis]GFJ86762.1 hypothetical protein Prum_004040 [Phytohabitans rumicis]